MFSNSTIQQYKNNYKKTENLKQIDSDTFLLPARKSKKTEAS